MSLIVYTGASNTSANTCRMARFDEAPPVASTRVPEPCDGDDDDDDENEEKQN